MPSHKRVISGDGGDEPPSILHRIRNMWQFANLCQWIYMFGKAAKIDDAIDIEEIETDCLKPQPTLLSDIALALLKLVSTHRGLTPDVLDHQIRKQYLAKAPKQNPFGSEINPVSFSGLDVFTKVKVLQKLTQWTMVHPERLREKMVEHKDAEQSNWRIEPYGWDKHDRVYYVLDDNRIYRFTEPQSNSPQLKPRKTKQYRTGRRVSKRRRISSSCEDDVEDLSDRQYDSQPPEDDLGGGAWECIAITLQETKSFIETLAKTRDGNEKTLRKQLETHLLPILEKQEEATKRRELQRERELLNLAKMANAKRSSRIADKVQKKKRDVEEKKEQRQRLEAERAEHREKLVQLKLEQERDSRMHARQRRLKEREARRMRHEEELAQLSEDSKHAPESARISERRLHAEIQRNQQALKDIEQEEDDWVFDCICGLHGQVDDGTHSVACESCNVWQHSKCLGIPEDEADQSEFRFVCSSCRRRDDDKNASPKTIIKIKVRPSKIMPNAPTRADAHTVSEVKHDSIIQSGQDRSAEKPSSLVLQRETRPNGLAMVSNQPPSQATISRLGSHRDVESYKYCNSSNKASPNISGSTALSESQSLATHGSSTAKQDVARNAQAGELAQLSLSIVDTKAPIDTGESLSSAPYLAPGDSKYSGLRLNQTGYSPLTQQSPTIVMPATHTKDNLESCKGAAEERNSSSAPDSLPVSITSFAATPGFVSTPIRPNEEHEAG
ncbi:PHD-finger motif containing protein [Metarhizium brunneum]